jgi:hypothetical protein
MPRLTKKQIEKRILALRSDLAISECMDRPEKTAEIQDEICGLAVDLVSHNYRLEYPPRRSPFASWRDETAHWVDCECGIRHEPPTCDLAGINHDLEHIDDL